jgi:membrane-bound serine protease (ClpP class)
VHYTAVMLLIASFVLMLLEAKFPSHGVLAGVGIVALVFGTLTLVDGPIPELRVELATAIACGVAFGLITAFLVRIAIRARRNKVLTGADALVGTLGIAQSTLAPRGQILVHGELWSAESAEAVQAGETVKVRAVRGLTLLVERVPATVPSPN